MSETKTVLIHTHKPSSKKARQQPPQQYPNTDQKSLTLIILSLLLASVSIATRTEALASLEYLISLPDITKKWGK